MTTEDSCYRCKICNEFLEGNKTAYMHILMALGLSLTGDLYPKFMRKVQYMDRMRRY